MLYNVVLYSKNTGEHLLTLKSYDGRPLRYTEKRYAELEVSERNNRMASNMDPDLTFIVVEENND